TCRGAYARENIIREVLASRRILHVRAPEDDCVVRERGRAAKEVGQAEPHQIDYFDPVAEGTRIVVKPLPPELLEFRRAGDDRDAPRIWLEAEHEVQRCDGVEVPDDPGKIGRSYQPLSVLLLDRPEDDWNVREDAIPGELCEPHSGLPGCDDHI